MKHFSHSKRLRIVKIVSAIVVILLLFIPASINHPQIDMRALVVALGIDTLKTDDEAQQNRIEVSVEIILPIEGGNSQGSSEVISGDGATLSEALSGIGISLGRSLELNHCGIVVLGMDYAKRGITTELEYLLSSGMVCPEINLTVSANQSANEFLQALSGYSQKLDLSNLLRYTDLGVQNYSRALVHFLRDCRGVSGTSAMPCFKMGYRSQNAHGSVDDGGEIEQDNEVNAEEDNKKNEENKRQALIENAKMTAVFGVENGVAKLKKVLDDEQTFGLAWMDSRTKKGYVFVDDFTFDGGDAGEIVADIPLVITSKKTSRRVSVEGEKTTFLVDIAVNLRIENRQAINILTDSANASVPKSLKNALKLRVEEMISNSIYSAYKDAKDENADVMLIEDRFFRCCNKAYKRLSNDGYDFLDSTEFKVKCSVTIN